MKFSQKSFKFYWSKLLALFFLVVLVVSYSRIFALAPIDEPYQPGNTLDPICPPGEQFCTVDISGGAMTYPTPGIANSNGSAWVTSIANNSANWNTAYDWGNHADAGYLTTTGSAALLTNFPTFDQNTTGTAGSIAGGLGGQILYQSASNTTSKLVNGNSGQVLTSQGTTLAPQWTTVPVSPLSIVNTSNIFSSGLSGTGSGVTTTDNSIFLGQYAGQSATNASRSNFLGYYAGSASTNASYSNFIGSLAGGAAPGASYSNFIGNASGGNAMNAFSSNFLGDLSGYDATNASNSIFIGQKAGHQDTVNNTSNTNDWSILLGYNTRTGGYRNSVLIGGSNDYFTPISNTKNNQFMLADSITSIRWHGVEYTLPSTQGSVSTILTNDGSGGLTWSAAGASMSYPLAGIAVSSGSAWGPSITNNSANWNTAYDWGNHADAGYLTTTGSAALLTNFPTLNQSTTGNAATATNLVGLTATITNLNTLTNPLGTAAFTASDSYATSAQINATNLQTNYLPKWNGSNFVDSTISDDGSRITTPAIKLTSNATDGYFLKSDAEGNGTWTSIAASQVYKGTWNATTNTPNLVDGAGIAGWYYRCTVGGTWNSISFNVGDDISYNGTTWERIPSQGYTLQTASGSVLGGIKIGSGINIDGGGVASVSTNYESPLSAGTTSEYYRGDKTWQTLDKSAVGLANVTNESKATMFASPTFTGTVSGITPLMVGAPSGSGSSTGINTNDETLLTIKTKLGAAGTSADGYLTSANWNSFNNKISSQWTTNVNDINFNSGNVGIGNISPVALLTIGTAGTKAGTLSLAGATSGTTTIAVPTTTTLTTLTLPANNGTNGYVLSTNGSGTTSWIANGSGVSNALSSLIAATAGNTINNAAYSQEWQWNTLTSGAGLVLSSNSTAAANNTQKVFSVSQTGVNSAAQTTFGGYFSNTKTGPAGSVNVGAYFTASGSDDNYGIFVESNSMFGSIDDYAIISSAGDLQLFGAADYLVGPNRYAFRYSGNENYGLVYNEVDVRYEFMDENGVRSFSIGGDNGDIHIKGKVGVGTSSPSTIFEIGSSDLGIGSSGPIITLGTNNNTTTTAAGSINFLRKNETDGYVWQDAAGNMRINSSAPTSANDTAGTVIGAQTSTRETKQDIFDYTDYDIALSMIVNAPLHTFRYKNEVNGYGSDSPLAKNRIGFIADEVDPAFMVGNVIDQVSINGILIASVKKLDLKIKEIELNTNGPSVTLLMSDFFGGVVSDVSDGIGHLKNIIVDTLKVGSPEKRTGITLYDEVTGEPYCLSISGGQTKTIPGECGIFEPNSQTEDYTDNGFSSLLGSSATEESQEIPSSNVKVLDISGNEGKEIPSEFKKIEMLDLDSAIDETLKAEPAVSGSLIDNLISKEKAQQETTPTL